MTAKTRPEARPGSENGTNSRPTPEIVTFGCRLNTHESAVMRAHIEAAGQPGLVVINSCAVTIEAERQVRRAIRRARREHPHRRIVVTGCAAQIDPGSYAAMPEVDRVVGNHEKLLAETWTEEAPPPVRVTDIQTVGETAGHLVSGFEGRARAFLQVQNGCDHRCTFCVIPQGRGVSRSVPVGAVAEQVRHALANGFNEVVLTGVDVTSYGGDLPGRPTLGQMIRRVLALVPELPRLRLSSLDPVEIDDDLWRLIGEEARLMPHLHLSLQAGSDLILKRMKRRHLRADAVALCQRARALRPDIVFGADLIAGFPTETEAQFADTLALVEDCGLTYLHVFPYSERPETPAARMPFQPHPVRKERAARLRAAGDRALARFLDAQAGTVRRVLVERGREGHTEHFARASIDRALAPGSIAEVAIEGHDGHRLQARVRRVLVSPDRLADGESGSAPDMLPEKVSDRVSGGPPIGPATDPAATIRRPDV
ncbi:MAG: tRNA (N(6)-L-threonylcarbamoyladenosine(37)-C(2))-methylthiotransferase MtaB [Azospirillaceae bacterium]